jgi:NTP pyrophosphatase (non-canonical NTP hydrolase)
MFSCGEAHERPADLIADIIQFCIYNDIDFEAELNTAYEYVTEEQGIDAETDSELLSNLEKRNR